VLLVDSTDRVLLFREFDPARPEHRYWLTPGGGMDEGESPAAGAARELAEETGLRLLPDELGEPVLRQVIEFPFDGRWYRQEQVFFLVRVPTWEVDTTGFTEVERACVDDHRWWTVEELDRTAETVYPDELTTILRRVLGDARPVVAGPDGPARPDGSAALDGPVAPDGPVGPDAAVGMARAGEETC